MQELDRLGHSIGLLTSTETSPQAVEGIHFVLNTRFSDLPQPEKTVPVAGLQGRFVSYWGIAPERPQQIAELVERERFEAVVVIGLHVLPYLSNVKRALRVWYAADEWLWHHWSQFRLFRSESWHELKDGAVKGVYERVFKSTTDRVWAVSPRDRIALRCVMGAKRVDFVPYGINTDFYCPMDVEKVPKSCVFWGRLDFGPNLDAVRWFGENVWSEILRRHPDALWRVFGFSAGDPIRRLQENFRFDLLTDLPDLRSDVQRSQIAVLPFISGGGIKNKLLEAASMGLPIVASKRAKNGLCGESNLIAVASGTTQWCSAIENFWANEDLRRQTASELRSWVMDQHAWKSAAQVAERSLSQ